MTDELQILLTILGGLVVGGSLGLLGGGGTILTVPLLLLLGAEPKPAIAMSLMVVAATAAVAAAAHARAGNVDWRAVALFGPATALGGYLGGRAAAWLAGDLLLLIFTALMVAVACAMLRSAPLRPRSSTRRSALALTLVGAVVGGVTGLVGAGGGFLFVPAFALFGGLPMRRAIGTSLVVISLNSLAALAGHLGHATVQLGTAGSITAAAAIGAWSGALLAQRAPEAPLRRAFGIFILLVAIWMLARSPYVHALLAG